MDSKLVGSFIRKRRISLKLTQRQIAEMLGFQTCQFISNIERGIADVPPSRIKDFADVLQVAPSDLASMVSDSMKNKLLRKTSISISEENRDDANNDPFIEAFALAWRTANKEAKDCIKFFVSKALGIDYDFSGSQSGEYGHRAGRPSVSNANINM